MVNIKLFEIIPRETPLKLCHASYNDHRWSPTYIPASLNTNKETGNTKVKNLLLVTLQEPKE